MFRSAAFIASVASVAVATTLFLTGCTGSIHTAPLSGQSMSTGVKLTPNPAHIYIAPFDTSTARWLVGQDRKGDELVLFKQKFQTNFLRQLESRLNKIAPTDTRWVDDLPDHGWLVSGEFVTVDQGSRALRTAFGLGLGETMLQTRVYVYDLSISKTQYVLSFRTGVPDADQETGAGSGTAPSGLAVAVEPVSTLSGVGSGLKLDTTRTCREISAILEQYLH